MKLVFAILLLAFAPSLNSEPRTLVRFPKAGIDIFKWMKAEGWEEQRGNPKHWSVGGERLLMVSDDDSVAIGTEEGFPIDPNKNPKLRFRFRVLEMPSGTDLSKKSKDDSAFRLYIAFDRDEGLFSPPHTIAYSWTEKLEVEAVVQSQHFDNLRYLSIGKGKPKDKQWITIERDLLADYRTIFGKASGVPNLKGILLKCDSNNTETKASSEVAFVELVAKAKVDETER